MIARVRSFFHRNAWPAGIVGITCSFFIADGILVATALRDKATGPEDNYYEKALRFDEQKMRSARSDRDGLAALVSVASVPLATMPRMVDLKIQDRTGRPVQGLTGTLTAIRPADIRLSNSAPLVAVPGQEGVYRMLLKLPVRGLWEFQVEAQRAGEAFRLVVRQDISL
jgi:nitrogen fixation protein FixH